MGAAAFWIALAAILIAGGYFRARKEQMKHETIRTIIGKTGKVDDASLKELFQPPPPPLNPMCQPWAPEHGTGFRMMRIFATLACFAGIGLAACFGVLRRIGFENENAIMIGFGWAIVTMAIGLGLFVASRYLPRPIPDDRERKANG